MKIAYERRDTKEANERKKEENEKKNDFYYGLFPRKLKCVKWISARECLYKLLREYTKRWRQ